jgi:hypothetical protein
MSIIKDKNKKNKKHKILKRKKYRIKLRTKQNQFKPHLLSEFNIYYKNYMIN